MKTLMLLGLLASTAIAGDFPEKINPATMEAWVQISQIAQGFAVRNGTYQAIVDRGNIYRFDTRNGQLLKLTIENNKASWTMILSGENQ